MDNQKYVICARFTIPGVPYPPLWDGERFSPVGWAAKLYDSKEEAEADFFIAVAMDLRAVGAELLARPYPRKK